MERSYAQWRSYATNWHGLVALQSKWRRHRYISHILQMLLSRPAAQAVNWRSEDGRRGRGRPRRTWQTPLQKDERDEARDSWSKRSCQWSCRLEKTCRPMFQRGREDISLSLSIYHFYANSYLVDFLISESYLNFKRIIAKNQWSKILWRIKPRDFTQNCHTFWGHMCFATLKFHCVGCSLVLVQVIWRPYWLIYLLLLVYW